MCVPLVAAAAVAGIAGGVAEGFSGYAQKKTEQTNYQMQAAGLARDIAAEKESSAYETARTREGIARIQGSARAGFAANGLALDGSAAEVLQDTETEGNLDIAAIKWNSDVKIGNLDYARKGAMVNAKAAGDAAPLAFITPILGSVAKFGGSFG